MIITREQIKTSLGISDDTHDDAIDAVLPLVDAKVKEITRRNWSLQIRGTLHGTGYIEVRTIGADPFLDAYPLSSRSVGIDWTVDALHEHLSAGLSVTAEGVPSDTFIEDVYSQRLTVNSKLYQAPVIKVSQSATESGDRDIIIGFNRAYFPVVSKLAWWMIDDQSTDTPTGSVASKSLGDISVSFSQTGAELDGRFGVPQWAVRGLPRYGRGY